MECCLESLNSIPSSTLPFPATRKGFAEHLSLHSSKQIYENVLLHILEREREKTRKVGCEYTSDFFDGSRYGYTRELNDLLGRKEFLQLATAVLGLEVGAACAYPETQQERSAKPPAASKRGKTSDRAGWIRSVGEDAPPMNSPLMKIEGTVDWPVFWARYACRGGFG